MGMKFDRIALMLATRNIFFSTLVALFLMQKSFKNSYKMGPIKLYLEGKYRLTYFKTFKIFSI